MLGALRDDETIDCSVLQKSIQNVQLLVRQPELLDEQARCAGVAAQAEVRQGD